MATSDEDVSAEFLATAASFIQWGGGRRARAPSRPARERVALFPDLTAEEEQAELEAARAWRGGGFGARGGGRGVRGGGRGSAADCAGRGGPGDPGGPALPAPNERVSPRLEGACTFPP